MVEPQPSESRAPGQLDVFRFAVAEKAALYRELIAVFADEKARYRIQLRSEDVARGLRERAGGEAPGEDELQLSLDQLTHWGNLRRSQDTSAVATLEEFYQRRSLYQLTPEGEEAWRGVLAVEAVLDSSGGRLSSVMLPAIAERLAALLGELGRDEPDAARLYTLLKELHDYSSELADNARRFMQELADSLEGMAATDEVFLSYKRAVLVYLERFIGELQAQHPRIVANLRELEAGEPAAMIELAATADEAPAPDGTRRGPVRELSVRWRALCAWFLGTTDRPSEIEHLRRAALDAIGRILRLLERLNERRYRRVDRAADLMQLAQWFADAASDDEARRLFSLAFGLDSARHFDLACEDEEVERGLSFADAPPVEVAPQLRASARGAATGRTAAGADYSAAKRDTLRAIRQRDEASARAAQRLLGHRQRLSELGELDGGEFDLLLELLDAALRSPPDSKGARRAMTASGRYAVGLWPAANGAEAWIRGPRGRLRTPDWTIELAARGGRSARRVS